MSLFVDLTEFFINPIRTGIQRVCGQLCSHLPQGSAVPVRLHDNNFVALPPALIEMVGRYFRQEGTVGADQIWRLSAVENGYAIKLAPKDRVLIPEVFDNPARVAFFRSLSTSEFDRCRFLVHDLLPFTHPEHFHWDGVWHMHGYYQLLRRASRCGFVSRYTASVYYNRLKRTEFGDGTVLPLGADALGPRPPEALLNRPPIFAVLGTIEPRKNHAMILDVFGPLLPEIEGLELWFLGHMGWVEPSFAERVRQLAARPNSRFRFFPSLDDHGIRERIEQSRAVISISTAEGYGLPPIESLWAGTPVISSTTIPSMMTIDKGVCFVDPLNVPNLRRAVLSLLDDQFANQLATDALGLNLPTWSSFTQNVLRWCKS